MQKGRIHITIGDTQVRPGVPTDHLGWIGQYIADQFWGQNVALIHLGDHWDMPSLSSYDKGKKEMEGRRYTADIEAGRAGFSRLNEPIHQENRRRRRVWDCDKHFLEGNHDFRITRACEADAQLEGAISTEDFNVKEWGWKQHGFLEPLWLNGIAYSHYFYHPNTGRPYSGENLTTRLKTIGHSFTQGHQQGINYAVRPVGNKRHHGLVNGSCYLHEEKYLGPQATAYWRGIVVCHQVEDGMFDPMFVSLDYLCRRYEGKTLSRFMSSHTKVAA